MKVLLTVACMKAVSATYGVPEIDLWALLMQEGGTIGRVSVNKNHTVDIGPFQINSSWLSTFTRIWRQPSNDATYDVLLNNGCWNAAAAAGIYRVALDSTGDRRKALGRYHSSTPGLAEKYVSDLERRYRALESDPAFRPGG
jgi:hypothetical protein